MSWDMKVKLTLLAVTAALPLLAQAADTGKAANAKELARGKYIVVIAGCNDCHTAGYALSNGKVAENDWLTGDRLGWRGPWGTTYASNLRLYLQGLTEAQWIARAKALQTRPPMPWNNVRSMTVADLRALYRYIRHLGPAGEPAPAFLPPDEQPPPPYVTFPAPAK